MRAMGMQGRELVKDAGVLPAGSTDHTAGARTVILLHAASTGRFLFELAAALRQMGQFPQASNQVAQQLGLLSNSPQSIRNPAVISQQCRGTL
jgi:hypothetical protein